MKIDNVILTCNFNKLYMGFWNPLSKLYKVNFGIDPILIFLGSENELIDSGLSYEYGQIIRQDPPISSNVSWTTTWALFYFTKLFPNNTILTMGIDQIPMGTKFIKDYIKNIDEDSYVMLIDDAYEVEGSRLSWSKGGTSPSSYHIAKGFIYNEIYSFEDTFQQEVEKIERLHGSSWGVDETYSSKILFNNKKNKIVNLSKFRELVSSGRLECYRNRETPYDLQKLNSNLYIECHACRPYENHKLYLDNLFRSIPKFVSNN